MQESSADIRLSGLVCVLNLDISTSLTRLLSILVLHTDDMQLNECSCRFSAASCKIKVVLRISVTSEALYIPACLMSTM